MINYSKFHSDRKQWLLTVICILLSLPLFAQKFATQFEKDIFPESTLAVSSNQGPDSTLQYAWILETNQWLLTGKIVYTYDSQGNEIQYIRSVRYESDQPLEPYEKHEYQYDENGNQTASTDYHWDDEGNQWIPGWKEEITYNEKGETTSWVYYNWDQTTGEWLEINKEESTYDESGNTTLEITYNWDQRTNQWINEHKTENHYDVYGNETEHAYFMWDTITSQWEGLTKTVMTYNDAAIMIQETMYEWDAETDYWKASRNYEYTYKEDGTPDLEIASIWSESDSLWVLQDKYQTLFNENGLPEELWSFVWDPSDSLWINHSKETLTFDANKAILSAEMSEWDSVTNQWIVMMQIEYTRDNMGNATSYVFSLRYDKSLPLTINYKYEIQYDSNGNMQERIYYHNDEITGQLSPTRKEVFYYAGESQSIPPIVPWGEAFVYPNPVSDNLSLSFAGHQGDAFFRLFDIHGREIYSQRVTEGERMNLRFLDKGVYLYTVVLGRKTHSGKLVKE